MSAVAVITARGGSIRVPRKNIRPFHGKPIIEYTIKAALESGCFDLVMVSTEDPEIAEIAREAGAAVPFMRSDATASGDVDLVHVLREVVGELEKRGRTFDYLALLMPCAPFLKADRLREALRTIEEKGADTVVSVVEFPSPVEHAMQIEDDFLKAVFPDKLSAHTQDLKTSYADAAQFYVLKVARFIETGEIFMPRCAAVVLPELEAQDIDTEADWSLAELKYEILKRVS